ncbi:hypothetical protein BLOT_009218 [Blomia tropicalis]|nr:hypothetical protein BLOT_009218 [Blomia tropicalis]
METFDGDGGRGKLIHLTKVGRPSSRQLNQFMETYKHNNGQQMKISITATRTMSVETLTIQKN